MSRFDTDALQERLRALVAETSIHLDAHGCARLAAYGAALLERGRTLNLTSARTTEAVFDILMKPSLGVQAAWPVGVPPQIAIDIGSGNGFPGVAVAATWPEARVVLVERRAKKARAMGDCLAAAGIENAEVLACDAREIKNTCPELVGAAELVTVRAVGSLEDTTQFAASLLAPCGRLVHWKSRTLTTDERRSGREAAAALGLDVLEDVSQPAGTGVLVVYVRREQGA